MKCEKCGTDLVQGEKFCRNCGAENVNNTTSTEEVTPEVVSGPNQEQRTQEANRLCIISLILYFGSSLIAGIINFVIGDSGLSNAITSLAALGPLAGIILMIVAKVKYPDNKFAKVLMWVYIGLTVGAIVLAIIAVVFFVALCGSLAERMQ
jgi:hypothetical protein